MTNKSKLLLIKLAHTAVWLVMAFASFYILYAGAMGKISVWLWFSIGLLFLETIVLFFNKWTCPLTPLAGKYTDERRENFDIFLPLVIAKYNKMIFGLIFVFGLLLTSFNLIN